MSYEPCDDLTVTLPFNWTLFTKYIIPATEVNKVRVPRAIKRPRIKAVLFGFAKQNNGNIVKQNLKDFFPHAELSLWV